MTAPKTMTERAVDHYLDSVESLLTALLQRPLDPVQEERLARLLQRSELDLLSRRAGRGSFTTSAVAAPATAAAPRSGRS